MTSEPIPPGGDQDKIKDLSKIWFPPTSPQWPNGHHELYGGEHNQIEGLKFALGHVQGFRTFRFVAGALRGIYYRQPWSSEVTYAYCCKTDNPWLDSNGNPIEGGEDRIANLIRTHSKGHMGGCKCGLYGYYRGSNDFYKDDEARGGMRRVITDHVQGIVQGFGEVVIGTRGFRASQARVVALLMPRHHINVELVSAQYPTVPIFDTFKSMVREFPPDEGRKA